MIKNLIFDFGGVIAFPKGNKEEFPRKLSELLNIDFKKSLEILLINRENLLTGEIKVEDFLNKNKKNNLKSSELLQGWRKLFVFSNEQINKDLLDYIDSLNKKFKIYVLSNTMDPLTDKNSKIYKNISNKFNAIFSSYEIHSKKPDKKAFTYVLGKINAKPEECILIDDIERNLISAEELGIKGIKFENNKNLFESLNNLLK